MPVETHARQASTLRHQVKSIQPQLSDTISEKLGDNVVGQLTLPQPVHGTLDIHRLLPRVATKNRLWRLPRERNYFAPPLVEFR